MPSRNTSSDDQQHQQRERGEGQPTAQPRLELLDDEGADQRHRASIRLRHADCAPPRARGANRSRPRLLVEQSRQRGGGRAALDAEMGHACSRRGSVAAADWPAPPDRREQEPHGAAILVDFELAQVAPLAEQRRAPLRGRRAARRVPGPRPRYCGAARRRGRVASPLQTSRPSRSTARCRRPRANPRVAWRRRPSSSPGGAARAGLRSVPGGRSRPARAADRPAAARPARGPARSPAPAAAARRAKTTLTSRQRRSSSPTTCSSVSTATWRTCLPSPRARPTNCRYCSAVSPSYSIGSSGT